MIPRPLKAIRFKADDAILVADKIQKMLDRQYLDVGEHVTKGLNYFAVPKGDYDIRVVFDGTSNGLNESLWSPNFFLPSA